MPDNNKNNKISVRVVDCQKKEVAKQILNAMNSLKDKMHALQLVLIYMEKNKFSREQINLDFINYIIKSFTKMALMYEKQDEDTVRYISTVVTKLAALCKRVQFTINSQSSSIELPRNFLTLLDKLNNESMTAMGVSNFIHALGVMAQIGLKGNLIMGLIPSILEKLLRENININARDIAQFLYGLGLMGNNITYDRLDSRVMGSIRQAFVSKNPNIKDIDNFMQALVMLVRNENLLEKINANDFMEILTLITQHHEAENHDQVLLNYWNNLMTIIKYKQISGKIPIATLLATLMYLKKLTSEGKFVSSLLFFFNTTLEAKKLSGYVEAEQFVALLNKLVQAPLSTKDSSSLLSLLGKMSQEGYIFGKIQNRDLSRLIYQASACNANEQDFSYTLHGLGLMVQAGILEDRPDVNLLANIRNRLPIINNELIFSQGLQGLVYLGFELTEAERELLLHNKTQITALQEKLYEHLEWKKFVLDIKKEHLIGAFFVDIYLKGKNNKKYVIELDGGRHYDSNGFLNKKDMMRDAWLEKKGYTVLRYKNPCTNEAFQAVIENISRVYNNDCEADNMQKIVQAPQNIARFSCVFQPSNKGADYENVNKRTLETPSLDEVPIKKRHRSCGIV